MCSFYAIITFDGFYASKLVTSGIIASNDLDLPKVNTVQPIRYPKSLDANKIKICYSSKIKGSIWKPVSGEKFCLRSYDIENWPQGIDSHVSKPWNK